MTKLDQSLEGKRVRLVYPDGETLTGLILDYISPEDNEPEGVSGLIVKCDQRDYLLGVNENDLASIELLEDKLTILQLEEHMEQLVSHVTFDYNGKSCGIDPISRDQYELWYGENCATATSLEKLMNTKVFDGLSIVDIWDKATDVDW